MRKLLILGGGATVARQTLELCIWSAGYWNGKTSLSRMDTIT